MTVERLELLGGYSRVSCGINGRPLAEPPIFDYSDLIDEEYDKKHKALMAYTKGDIVRTTEMMDQYIETQLLATYLGWAGGMIDKAVGLHHESEGFYNSLKEDVKYETIEALKPGLLSLIVFKKQNDGSYVADTLGQAQARNLKRIRRVGEDIRSLGKEQAGNQTGMREAQDPLVEAKRRLKEVNAWIEEGIRSLSEGQARNEEEMMMSEGKHARMREFIKRLKEGQFLDERVEKSIREVQAKVEESAKNWRGAQAGREEALRNVKEERARITEAGGRLEEEIRQLPFEAPESEPEDMVNMPTSTSDNTANKAQSQPNDFEDVLEPTTLSQLALNEQHIVTLNQGERQPLLPSTLQATEFKNSLVLLLLILASGIETFFFKCWLFIMEICRLLDEQGREED